MNGFRHILAALGSSAVCYVITRHTGLNLLETSLISGGLAALVMSLIPNERQF